MRFWDASAVVPLVVDEPRSAAIDALIDEDSELLVWWGTPVEVVSALARREREGSLTAVETTQAIAALTELTDSWEEIVPSERIRRTATRLLRQHRLRAADSLQLAAALVAADDQPAYLDIVSLDSRLNEVARQEGFRVIEPG
jgi:predicted nucleic acid-binding protein